MEPGKLFDTPSSRFSNEFRLFRLLVSRKLQSYMAHIKRWCIDLKCMHVLQPNSIFFLQAASLSICFLCASTHCWIAVSTITESPKRCYALPLFIVLVPKSSSLLKCYSISLLSAQNVHNHDDLVMQFHTCPKFEHFFNFPVDSIL